MNADAAVLEVGRELKMPEKPVKVDQVGQELGVRHVLEGSVRKAGDRVRLTAQLVDVSMGGHLWAERYDRDLEDIFALQDEVAQKIVSVLAVKLTDDEQERLEHRYTDNLESYDYFLRGLEYFNRLSKERTNLGRRLFERAIDLDPKFATAYGHMSLTYWLEWSFGWTQDFQILEKAFELAQRLQPWIIHCLKPTEYWAFCIYGKSNMIKPLRSSNRPSP